MQSGESNRSSPLRRTLIALPIGLLLLVWDRAVVLLESQSRHCSTCAPRRRRSWRNWVARPRRRPAPW